MERVKELLTNFRNAVAFSYSWLVICCLALTLFSGKDTLGAGFLLKLLVLCIWASISFVLCFRTHRMQKRGFIFSLTCFYIMLIPAEIGLFYLMGIFKGPGSPAAWIIFLTIIAVMYIVSVLIDNTIMKKDAVDYTRKLTEYIKNK